MKAFVFVSASVNTCGCECVCVCVCVCVCQLCISDSYSSPGVDLEPDSGNSQAAVGHGHLGLARGGYSPGWGGGFFGTVLRGVAVSGQYYRIGRCVIRRQGRINTPLLLLHPSASSSWYDGERGDWTHSCPRPLSMMDEAGAEHQWHARRSLTRMCQCIGVCILFNCVCEADGGRTEKERERERERERECDGVPGISQWRKLITFNVWMRGTKGEICAQYVSCGKSSCCLIGFWVGEVLSVQLFQLPGRFSFLREIYL